MQVAEGLSLGGRTRTSDGLGRVVVQEMLVAFTRYAVASTARIPEEAHLSTWTLVINRRFLNLSKSLCSQYTAVVPSRFSMISGDVYDLRRGRVAVRFTVIPLGSSSLKSNLFTGTFARSVTKILTVPPAKTPRLAFGRILAFIVKRGHSWGATLKMVHILIRKKKQ